MNTRTFQHDFARTILRCSNELQYDDALELVRLMSPEIQRVIIEKEMLLVSKKIKKKKQESGLEYNKVI